MHTQSAPCPSATSARTRTCPRSNGEHGIDMSKLRSKNGAVTLDNGFVNTAACESAITFIDGEAGVLRYRGIPIEELVSVPVQSFLETSYLLIYGELPTRTQLD